MARAINLVVLGILFFYISNNYLLFVLIIYVFVLETPKEPYLLIDGHRLDPGNLFVPVKENMDLSIECVVEGGNPMPSLHWLLFPSNTNLENEAMSSGLLQSNESYQENDVSRSSAKIQRVLRAHHNATVSCIVTHVTLVNPLNTSILLDVQCKSIN